MTKEEFAAMNEQIVADTTFRSDIISAILHPNFQKIVSEGEYVLPWIFEEILISGRCHWFHFSLVNALVGSDIAVPEKSKGFYEDTIKIYLEWGHNHGYVQWREVK